MTNSLRLFAASVLLLAACAHRPSSSARISPAYASRLERAQAMMNERRHGRALAELDDAVRAEPQRSEGHGYRAQVLFRMDRFAEATEACAAAAARLPELPWVWTTCWATRLEREGAGEGSRRGVRADLESRLAASGRSPEALLAAYEGHVLLGDEGSARSVALELAARAPGTPLEGEAQAILFDVLLRASEARDRIAVAEHYLVRFPEGRNAFDVTRVLLREVGSSSGDALEVASRVADGRRVGRGVSAAVAWWLVERGKAPDRAADLARRSLGLLDEEGAGRKPEGFTDQGWDAQLRGERELYRYVLGRALLLSGDVPGARAELAAAADGDAAGAGAHYFLAQAATADDRVEEAILHLRAALRASGRRPEAERQLESLLRRRHGWTGDARRFFVEREGGVSFSDVTVVAGLGGVSGRRVAWADYDGDDRDDLLVDGSRLFRNRGDGTFEDVSENAGLGGVEDANGGAWADVDNDGRPDLAVTRHDGNRLFRNAGGGRLEDVTERALGHPGVRYTEAAAWGDLDNDGFLDLYLANYERPGIRLGACTQDQVLKNRGDGTFSDVSGTAGILSEEPMCGRGVTWVDFDLDGRQDILVANYRLDPNFLWRNAGDGGFSDVAGERGARGRQKKGAFGHTIAIAAGDVDGDGVPDLYVSNLAHPRYIEYSDTSLLLAGSGPPSFTFVDRSPGSGIGFEETSSDAAFADVDNDGDLDLYVTSVYPGRESHLYLNDGGWRFVDSTWLSGVRVTDGWGAAFSDYDGDGFADLVVGTGEGVRLLRNEGTAHAWVAVKLTDIRCNRLGVGAKVTVRCGDSKQQREITAGRGTGSQDSLLLPFGLGSCSGPVEVEARTLCGDLLHARSEEPRRTVLLDNATR